MILFLFKPTQEVQVNKEEMRAKLAAMVNEWERASDCLLGNFSDHSLDD